MALVQRYVQRSFPLDRVWTTGCGSFILATCTVFGCLLVILCGHVDKMGGFWSSQEKRVTVKV